MQLVKHISHPVQIILYLLLSVVLMSCPSQDSSSNLANILAKHGCDPTQVRETDGHRRLALIVGVGQYLKKGVTDLKGPPNDAKRFQELLTHQNGYRFPAENVCVLIDQEATTEGFRQVFEKSLLGRVKSEDDVVMLIFAMHGSQTRDRNGDEPDEWDETLMFHDARVGGVRDLVDDELYQWLRQLHNKTKNVTMVLDTCNFGIVTRAPDAGTTMARFQTPDEVEAEFKALAEGVGDGGAGWEPKALPGMVIFSAASDGNPALEINGEGVFSNALLQVMARVGDRPLTYAQVARQIPNLIAAESKQISYFHGDLNKPVLGNTDRVRPISWEVKALGPQIELSGIPLPGIGVGAELRIYDGSASGAETRDPAKAKATVVVSQMVGLNAKVRLDTPERRPIAIGDIAVLARPADKFVTLKVRLRPSDEPGGIPKDQTIALRKLVAKNNEATMLVELTEGAGDFEISVSVDGSLVLKGPENRIRNVYNNRSEVARSLWRHARQRALLYLHGEGGSDFTDNETLLAQLIEAPLNKQSKCANGIWHQAEPNQEQVVPLCHKYHLQVTLAEDAPNIPLLIGALILSTDGSIYALPSDNSKVRLLPGQTKTFDEAQDPFIGIPPLDVQDRIIVFGTQEKNSVSWADFTETAQTRSMRATRGQQGAFYRSLDRYFKPGTRGTGKSDEGAVEVTTWTLSTVELRVVANSRFLESDGDKNTPISKREYTIAKFDIRPHLPDDENSALYKVLTEVDSLASSSIQDGYGYKQHDWSLSTDEANLARGIDCSRAIWFAFTRAGLSYNSDNRYLTTADMVKSNTQMKHEFQSCTNDPNLQIGDVIVYRDDERGDGHVVMVIDAEKRIAWGSHGWDGNPRILPVEPDTGVEYQKIKYKQDWERWDRKTMQRKTCWRYRGFIEDRAKARGEPGIRVLADMNICNPKKQCGMM